MIIFMYVMGKRKKTCINYWYAAIIVYAGTVIQKQMQHTQYSAEIVVCILSITYFVLD